MTTGELENPIADVNRVIEALQAEILGIMNLADQVWAHTLIAPLFQIPCRKLAGLLVRLDLDIARCGLPAGIGSFLARFVQDVRASGVDSVPKEGPLLVVSNHPAAYDVVILSRLLGRDDLKIISSNISVVSCLPAVAPHFIFTGDDPFGRIATVRSAIRHLLNGGALLIFPRGEVEADPAVSPGALDGLARWSESLDLFLRNAPQTQTIVSIVSGVLSGRWFHNPLVRLWKEPERRQKVAEIFQVVQHVIKPGSLNFHPAVTFSPPLRREQISPESSTPGGYLKGIQTIAGEMLEAQSSMIR
jgi:hypothetical protein